MKEALGIACCIGLIAAAPVRAAIQVSIDRPSPDQPIRADTRLQASVTSDYELASVKVQYAGREQSLIGGQAGIGPWVGSTTILFDTLLQDWVTFTVTATDVLGNTGSAEATYMVLLPPAITILEPRALSVAWPCVRIAATCSSSPSLCTLALARVFQGSWTPLLDPVRPPIDVFDCPDAYVGREVGYVLRARDLVNGAETTARVNVLVDPSPWYRHEEQPPGEIIDWDDRRILFRGDDGRGAILDRVTREITGLDASVGTCRERCDRDGYCPCVSHGGLVPGGAVLVHDINVIDVGSSGPTQVIGQLSLPLGFGTGWFMSRGGAVLWESPLGFPRIHRRLRDGGVETLSVWNPSLGPDGTLVYTVYVTDPYPTFLSYVFIERGEGVPEQLTDAGEDREPTTDGTNALFARNRSGGDVLALHTAGGLETFVADTLRPRLTAGGWVVFSRSGPTGIPQLWERAPDGGERQMTFWSSPSTVEAVEPSGSFVYRVEGTRSRWLGFPDGGRQPVGSWLGKPRWAGAWYVAMGDRLFRVADQPRELERPDGGGTTEPPPPPPPDRCGCSAAGWAPGALALFFGVLAGRRRAREVA